MYNSCSTKMPYQLVVSLRSKGENVGEKLTKGHIPRSELSHGRYHAIERRRIPDLQHRGGGIYDRGEHPQSHQFAFYRHYRPCCYELPNQPGISINLENESEGGVRRRWDYDPTDKSAQP